MPAFFAGALGLLAVLLDGASRRGWRWARPPAVNRQVPRNYGYRFGPWRAAARYGLRMGLGPATILASWVWWAAFVIGSTAGVRWIVLGSLSFALARTVSMYVSVIGVHDGLSMAARGGAVGRVEPVAVRAAGVLVVVACVLALARSPQ